MTGWLERWQVPLHLAAIAAGAAIGLGLPAAGSIAEAAVEPALIALLYVTFLAVPFARLPAALRDVRFLAALLVLNFVLVPLFVLALSRLVTHDEALLVGVLLVLLTPCIDYVIVFSRMAGGAWRRLLAASPLLMLLQLVLLPGYLALFVGPELAGVVEPGPFLRAFLLLIALPLGLAVLTQLLARRLSVVALVERGMTAIAVPIMMLALVVIVASQIGAVATQLPRLAPVVPVFAAFLIIMAVVGALLGRAFRQPVAERRALAFSGATRNSLVVLPLAIALPASLGLVPAVVVTQTLIELLGMAVLVWVVPRAMRAGVPASGSSGTATPARASDGREQSGDRVE